jgi:hypothetical protein
MAPSPIRTPSAIRLVRAERSTQQLPPKETPGFPSDRTQVRLKPISTSDKTNIRNGEMTTGEGSALNLSAFQGTTSRRLRLCQATSTEDGRQERYRRRVTDASLFASGAACGPIRRQADRLRLSEQANDRLWDRGQRPDVSHRGEGPKLSATGHTRAMKTQINSTCLLT